MTSRDLIGDRFLVRCVRCAVVCVFQACPCLVVGRGNEDTAYAMEYFVRIHRQWKVKQPVRSGPGGSELCGS